MASDTHDISRDRFMLVGGLSRRGYDWWWHSFTGHHAQTGKPRAFFIEFFTCNPALGGAEPVLGQLPANKEAGKAPSYVMVKAGSWVAMRASCTAFLRGMTLRLDAMCRSSCRPMIAYAVRPI